MDCRYRQRRKALFSAFSLTGEASQSAGASAHCGPFVDRGLEMRALATMMSFREKRDLKVQELQTVENWKQHGSAIAGLE